MQDSGLVTDGDAPPSPTIVELPLRDLSLGVEMGTHAHKATPTKGALNAGTAIPNSVNNAVGAAAPKLSSVGSFKMPPRRGSNSSMSRMTCVSMETGRSPGRRSSNSSMSKMVRMPIGESPRGSLDKTGEGSDEEDECNNPRWIDTFTTI